MSERVVVTGAAGFIGSHLSERLVRDGFEVTGIDSFTDYYDPARKRQNVEWLKGNGNFRLVEEDINRCALREILDGCSIVFH
ncbi:MAG TPA: GDP-mannose 4,6-dehydratase, partial [Candidatus Krumholzibacterium sp.]|nr:GDP-mannose 4,6-dehydratase [Candidatus Krumholzibacterium sp.]